MKSFSIKTKLILSFSSISILLIIYSLYSINSFNKSSNHFSNYRNIAKGSIILGRVQSNMLMIRLNVKDYIKTTSQKDIEEFNYYYTRTEKFIQEAKTVVKNETIIEKIEDIDFELNEYKISFEKMVKLVNQRNDIVKNSLDVDGKRIEQLLTFVMNSAEADGDVIASLKTAKGIRTLLLSRLYTSKFLITNLQEDLDRVEKEFVNLEKELAEIKNSIQNQKRIKNLHESIGLINNYIANVQQIRNIILSRNRIIQTKLNVLGADISEDSEEIKLSLKEYQDRIGPRMEENNKIHLNSTIIVSGMIILFAILISFVIIRKTTQSLREFEDGLLNIFNYLNKDVKEYKYIDINSNDEIGEMSKIVNDNIEKTTQLLINEERNKKIIEDQSKMVAMGEMIGNIAHQWRQPLSVISTCATGMKINKELDTLSREEIYSFCDAINKNAQYLSKTIDDFKNYIKGDRIKRKFSLEESINNFLSLIDSTKKSNSIDIILDLEKNIKINGYENELIQCFINIFNNSKDALNENVSENRLIFIETFTESNQAIIKIKDNAHGIQESIFSKIFEPYISTKHKSLGTGLGLNMTYNLIVDGMKGTIKASNVEYFYKDHHYSGAEFTIILPLN